jgi:hypothetical protein
MARKRPHSGLHVHFAHGNHVDDEFEFIAQQIARKRQNRHRRLLTSDVPYIRQ